MVKFGDTDPLLQHNDDDDDDFNVTPSPSGEDISMTTMWGREREPKNAEISLIRGGIPELLEEVSLVIAREKLDLEYPERKSIKLRVENGEVFAITNAFSKRALGNMKCSEETEDFKSLSSIV